MPCLYISSFHCNYHCRRRLDWCLCLDWAYCEFLEFDAHVCNERIANIYPASWHAQSSDVSCSVQRHRQKIQSVSPNLSIIQTQLLTLVPFLTTLFCITVDYQAQSNSWTFLEVDVSIICASLPLLKAPLQRLLPRVFGTRSSAAGSGYPDAGSHALSGSEPGIPMKKRTVGADKNDAASDEEEILESRTAITKTMDVTLEYEEIDSDKDTARRREADRFDFGLKR